MASEYVRRPTPDAILSVLCEPKTDEDRRPDSLDIRMVGLKWRLTRSGENDECLQACPTQSTIEISFSSLRLAVQDYMCLDGDAAGTSKICMQLSRESVTGRKRPGTCSKFTARMPLSEAFAGGMNAGWRGTPPTLDCLHVRQCLTNNAILFHDHRQ